MRRTIATVLATLALMAGLMPAAAAGPGDPKPVPEECQVYSDLFDQYSGLYWEAVLALNADAVTISRKTERIVRMLGKIEARDRTIRHQRREIRELRDALAAAQG